MLKHLFNGRILWYATFSGRISSSPSRTSSCSSLARGMLNSKSPKEACAIFNSISKQMNPRKDLESFSAVIHILTNAKLCGVLINGMCNAHELAATRSLDMVKLGIHPNLFVDSSLIHGHYGAGDIPGAMQLCSEMVSLKLSPDVFTPTILIDGLRQKGRIDEAYIPLRKIKTETLISNSVSYYVLRNLSVIDHNKQPAKHTRSFLSHFSRSQSRFLSVVSTTDVTPTSGGQISNTEIGSSSNNCSRILKSVIYSHFDNQMEFYLKASLKDLLLDISEVVPDVSRSLRRHNELKPEDVLKLLLAFESEMGNVTVKGDKVEALWAIFRWARMRQKGFKHLKSSYNCMVSILMCKHMLDKVESLLVEMESQGILLDDNQILSHLIQSFARVGNLERAISLFALVREQSLVPSLPCYLAYIELLVQMQRAQEAYLVSMDLVLTGVELSDICLSKIGKVIQLLCFEGNLREARNLLRKISAWGFKLNNSVSQLACGYCEKQDFEDLLGFYAEMGCRPDVLTANRVLNEFCRKFGVEKANLYRHELESLGFVPDETTIGILIGWSCRVGNIRSAFIFLSEVQSKGLKPDLHSYNALIAGVFRKGMWESVSLILDELIEVWETPRVSTYMVLLAGYCRARRFEEAKTVINEMLQHDIAVVSPEEDFISQAFTLLGFDPSKFRLKRDSGMGLSKAEFTDHLGNGLYLDADLNAYEKRLNKILETSMLPDFNLFLRRECDSGNLVAALQLLDEMVRWGQELSYKVFDAILRGLCTSRSQINNCVGLLEKWPKMTNQLNHDTLNYLVIEYSKKGLSQQGMLIFNRMVEKGILINNETYMALINILCKKGTLEDFQKCWRIAAINKWLPNLDQCGALWECLFRRRMLKESLELFERMLDAFPYLSSKLCNILMEKLCMASYMHMVYASTEELGKQGIFLDPNVHSHLLKWFSRQKKFVVSFAFLDSMLTSKLDLSVENILLLILEFCKGNACEKAIALAETTIKLKSTDTSLIYSCLVEGLCTAGKIADAENLFLRMCFSGFIPNDDTFNILLQAHCQAKNSVKVLEVLGIMIRRRSSISMPLYRNLVRLMCSEAKFLLVLNLKDFALQQNKLSSLVIFNILIFYMLRSGNYLPFSGVFDELEARRIVPDETTYNFLIHGFFRQKDSLSSMNYFLAMVSKGLKPNYRSLRIMVCSLCDHGEVAKAMRICQEMECKGWILGSMIQNIVVEALLAHGKLDEAESFLEHVQHKNLTPDSVDYNNLIRKFSSLGRPGKAIHLLNIMLKKGSIPDSLSYDSLIRALCICSSPAEALDFHNEMLDRGLRPSTESWKVLVQRFCEVGQAADAEKLLLLMNEIGERPAREMFEILIDQYKSENHVQKVMQIMQLMQRSGYEPDFGSHWSLIRNLSSSKHENNKGNSHSFLSSLLSRNES